MSSSRRDKWFMIKSSNGGHEVVNYRSVDPESDMRIGSVVTINKPNGERDTATIIGSSRDRQILEQQIAPAPRLYENIVGLSPKNEAGDFSASEESDWAPSDEHSTDDDDAVNEVENKFKRIRRSYSNKRASKIMKPSHRADAVVTSLNNNRKRPRLDRNVKRYEKPNPNQNETNSEVKKKSLPDSTRKNYSPAPVVNRQNIVTKNAGAVTINVQDIIDMKQCFDELFKILNELKPAQTSTNEKDAEDRRESLSTAPPKKPMAKSERDVVKNITQDFDEYEYHSDDIDRRSEESHRSDDNVLITNKYDTVESNKVINEHDINSKKRESPVTNSQDSKTGPKQPQEWIPIGSGKTLLHKDQYRKVNWKSYTIATRTLLLALFPRRILATHSMTGKRSPAFQDKPAKMCLDPKIVTDVIIEITERFKVKENLVRSIITTKCADECKMLKMRMRRKTSTSKLFQDHLSPDENDDIANQTC